MRLRKNRNQSINQSINLDSSEALSSGESSEEIATELPENELYARALRAPLASPISDFSATVTAGGTTMHAGDTKNITGQKVTITGIELKFTLTQDGTLHAGDKIRIPVTLTNNSYAAYYRALSSDTAVNIGGVGTLEFDHSNPSDLAYVITVDSSFAALPNGSQRAILANVSPASGTYLQATSSHSSIGLTINGSSFTFTPVPRTFPKDVGDFSTNTYAYDSANDRIDIATGISDANYMNNMLSSNGTNPGDTGIPEGDLITIQRATTIGSSVINTLMSNKPGIVSPKLSEDGTYIVQNDSSTGLSVDNGSATAVTLPADATDTQIIQALKAAGPNSRVMIENSDGTYTFAYNFGKLTGPGSLTYHDVRSQDDMASYSDQYQEIDRTDAVNAHANSVLAHTNILHGFNHVTAFFFSDQSVVNTVRGTSTRYSVTDDGTITEQKTNNFQASTRISSARSEGQSKVTVRYVDTDGHEIDTRAFGYGFPAGSPVAAQSPDFNTQPKTIAGYTLITVNNPVTGVPGQQLTTATSIPFESNDKEVYFVYSANKGKVTVTYIDDTTGATLETKELTGVYGTTDSYTTAPTIHNYENQGYEFVSDNYPSGGASFSSTPQQFEVHLKHGTESAQETKDVTLTVRYHGAGSLNPADNVQTAHWTRSVTKDKVTGQTTPTGAWTSDKASYTTVVTPVIAGYTADRDQVTGMTVTMDDIVEDVNYSAQDGQTPNPTPDPEPSPNPDPSPSPDPNGDKPEKTTNILPETGDTGLLPVAGIVAGSALVLGAFGAVRRFKRG